MLIDPYLSRLRRITPNDTVDPADTRPLYDNATIAQSDTRIIDAHIQRADFVLLTHTHYDHALDAPYERDRMLMARQPGMLHKHVPLDIDPTTGNPQAGGRYLFDTEEHAESYNAFVEDFTVDGVKFFDRPCFLDHECYAWSAIGARDFADIHTSQVVLRTERWQVPAHNQRPVLKDRCPIIRAAALARGMSSVWLLYNRHEQLVALVSFVNRLVPKNRDGRPRHADRTPECAAARRTAR